MYYRQSPITLIALIIPKKPSIIRSFITRAIFRLVAVAQSGAYLKYVSICGASQTPKEPC